MDDRPLAGCPLDPRLDPFTTNPGDRREFAALLRQHCMRFCYFLEMSARGAIEEARTMIPVIGDDMSMAAMRAATSGDLTLAARLSDEWSAGIAEPRHLRATEPSIQLMRNAIVRLMDVIERDLQVEVTPEWQATRDTEFQAFMRTAATPSKRRRARPRGKSATGN
jgi:hypothetical protein